ncbi:MAG: glycosyltransferase family 2 protein [Oscillospiraceae bacterium]|nr:glycosyltransferase family 2 protein [Oscillospiraceae bacterium]
MDPLVSVIMPAYRCAGTIAAAIDSVLIQNVALELIIVNDCSPDNVSEVLAAYCADERVRVVTNEKNMGAAKSRNRGVSMARGKYVAFLDSDDLWMPGKLAAQVQVLEESGCVLCCTARELMTPDWKPTGKVLPVAQTITYNDLLKHNSIACSSVVLRAEAAREFPMDHEDSHEDYILWLRVLEKYGAARGINEPMLRYRLSNTGKSGSKLHSAKMTFMVYRYMGFSLPKSIACFVSYAFNGVKKYYFARKGGQHEA